MEEEHSPLWPITKPGNILGHFSLNRFFIWKFHCNLRDLLYSLYICCLLGTQYVHFSEQSRRCTFLLMILTCSDRCTLHYIQLMGTAYYKDCVIFTTVSGYSLSSTTSREFLLYDLVENTSNLSVLTLYVDMISLLEGSPLEYN